MAPGPTPSTASGVVSITIEASGKLGLSLGPSADEAHLEVKAVAPGGLAATAAAAAGDAAPPLRAGLLVSAVMGQSTCGLVPATVLQLIKAAGRPLSLSFGSASEPAKPPVPPSKLVAPGSIAELPSAVQLQIASLATASPSASFAAGPFEPSASVGYCRYGRIAAALAEESCCFTVADEFVSVALAQELLAAARRMDTAGELRAAGVGTGPTHRHDTAVRGDRIAWLPRATEEFPMSILLRQFNALREALARSAARWAPMRGGHCKCMLACYPTGTRYVRHRDTSPLLPGRVATAILYLNDDWKEGDGGELKIHFDGAEGASTIVAPAFGRLVVFDSRTEHEVLEFRGRERWAITAFMYRADAVASAPTLTSVPQILVAIASYRDEECLHTVDALFRTASIPDRVKVAVLDQSDHDTDGDCVSAQAREEWQTQIGVHTLHWSLAKGPCWARAMLQQCLEDEGYYLQIDSHMRFVDGWDELLMRQLADCQKMAAKPILSTYPLGYHRPDQLPAHRLPTLLCADGFRTKDVDGRDIVSSLRLRARVLLVPPKVPVRSLFWAAGFSFSSSEAAVEIPYDDSLKFLFFGEEASMCARYWTNGWDIFAPTQAIVFHLWDRSYRPSFREIPDQSESRAAAETAVAGLLGVLPSAGAVEPETEPEPDFEPELETEPETETETETETVGGCCAGDTGANGRPEDSILNRNPLSEGGVARALGGERTLQSFSDYCGVDFAQHQITAVGRFGGQDPSAFIPDSSETEGASGLVTA